MVISAVKIVANNAGCLCNFTVKGNIYNTVAFNWNVYKNKGRKCSNISVKKYQNKPMFGCKSSWLNLKRKNIFQHENYRYH